MHDAVHDNNRLRKSTSNGNKTTEKKKIYPNIVFMRLTVWFYFIFVDLLWAAARTSAVVCPDSECSLCSPAQHIRLFIRRISCRASILLFFFDGPKRRRMCVKWCGRRIKGAVQCIFAFYFIHFLCRRRCRRCHCHRFCCFSKTHAHIFVHAYLCVYLTRVCAHTHTESSYSLEIFHIFFFVFVIRTVFVGPVRPCRGV